jgi:ATP-dependent 26S proteasome regulatory subunit
MELLSQLDGFDVVGKVKMIMATNRWAAPAAWVPGRPPAARLPRAAHAPALDA